MSIAPLLLSVVIPCRNEKDYIENCVESILRQQKPLGEFEVIVADGMSDDGTRALLKRLNEKDARVRVIDNHRQTTPCGMNLGIQHARGRYIAIMGAHNRYAPDYLLRSVNTLERTGADNVGGAMFCEGKTRVQRAICAAHHSPFSVGGARWHNINYEGPVDTVFGGVYRREVFDRIGPFDEELVRNQDDELNLRLVRSGGKIWQSPLIRSWYQPRASLLALMRQYKQYGYWKVRVIQKHKLPASPRHLVPSFFIFCIVLLFAAGFIWSLAFLLLIGLIAVYATLNVLASATAAARHGWNLFPVLPVVFSCYHFSYGYGFFSGIIDFLILRRGARRSYVSLSRIDSKS